MTMTRQVVSTMRRALTLTVTVLVGTAGCAAPISQLGTVSRLDVEREAAAQRRFVIETEWTNEARVDRLLAPLARGSVPLCETKALPVLGARLAVRESWAADYRETARELGFGDSVTVESVMPGTPASALLRRGDRIVGVNGMPVRQRTAGLNAFIKYIGERATKGDSAISLVVARQATDSSAARTDSVTVRFEKLCSGNAVVVRDDAINAFADGQNVYVTTAMLRFASDEELQTVLAHEIAHNAAKHIEAKQRNAGIGALFGAIIDIAAASQGINTGGDFTSQFAALGGMTFSQDFEREADYVGSYILARSGLPTDKSPMFWRRMAAESPGSIKFASSHPTSTERFVRLSQYHTEIAGKQSAREALVPNRK